MIGKLINKVTASEYIIIPKEYNDKLSNTSSENFLSIAEIQLNEFLQKMI